MEDFLANNDHETIYKSNKALGIAKIYLLIGNLDETKKIVDKYVNDNAVNTFTHYQVASMYGSINPEQAFYHAALIKTTNLQAFAYKVLANQFEAEMLYSEAYEALRHVLELKDISSRFPAMVLRCSLLGGFADSSNLIDSSLELITDALAKDKARSMLAEEYANVGELRTAMEILLNINDAEIRRKAISMVVIRYGASTSSVPAKDIELWRALITLLEPIITHNMRSKQFIDPLTNSLNWPQTIGANLFLGEKMTVAENKTGSFTAQIKFRTKGGSFKDMLSKQYSLGWPVYDQLSRAGLIEYKHLGGFVSGWKGSVTYYSVTLTPEGKKAFGEGQPTRNSKFLTVKVPIADKTLARISQVRFTNPARTEAVIDYKW